MSIKTHLAPRVVRRFSHPSGLGGRVAGWVMSRRPSNLERNRWAVDLLDIQPTDRVIEIGCGPGIAIAALAERACEGLVVGVDRSDVMIHQARRRNKEAIEAGRIRLVHAAIEHLDAVDGPFDAALAVNTVGFWPEPTAQLRKMARMMRAGGRIALVSQPRCPGATAATSTEAGHGLAALLTAAGFDELRTETLALDPPVACVLATLPAAEHA